MYVQYICIHIFKHTTTHPRTHTHTRILNKTLVKYGANVDAADNQGNTPLHLLCTEKRKMDTLSDSIAMLVRLNTL